LSIRIKFCGAAGTVTGSCYLVTHPGGRFLVDCGMFQGSKTLRELNYGAFPFDPAGLDFAILTHAHIDHSGLVPKLCLAGFKGPVYASEGTRELLAYMLPDSGHIQETDVERLNRRNSQRGRPTVTPIYTQKDAEACLARFAPLPFEKWCEIGTGVRARLWNAGHILGAASVELEIATGVPRQRFLNILFSGDLGPGHKAFHRDPDAPENFDYLVVESTYGNRERLEIDPERRRALLADEVRAALKAGGNLLIPAFAVERTQELLYDLTTLFDSGALPRAPVFLDSPLAIKATGVFQAHLAEIANGNAARNPFVGPNIRYVTSVEESKALNRIASGAVIIAASGMCDAGRIRDHLLHNLWRPDATVLIVGYQAPGTLGSLLLQGVPSVRIHGEELRVRARIRNLDVYSGHADRRELIRWVRERLPVRRAIFLTHGEQGALESFREALLAAGCLESDLYLPRLDETVELGVHGRLHRIKPEPGAGPRLAAGALAPTDWHNAYAAFLLDFGASLRALPDDKARTRLLDRLRRVLGKPAGSAADSAPDKVN
jgi:metallo-beta-lactamase family protein